MIIMSGDSRGTMIFNNKSSEEFGLWINFPLAPSHGAPVFTNTKVPGKSGEVLDYDGSLNNGTLTVDTDGSRPKQFENMFEWQSAIMEWLITDDYSPLQFSFWPTYYYEAALSGAPTFTSDPENVGQFKMQMQFTVHPYAFATNGIDWQKVPKHPQNVENTIAWPDWHIVGNGNFTLKVNDKSYSFKDIDSEVFVNGENAVAYQNADGTVPLNDKVIWDNNDAPYFVHGMNTVSLITDNGIDAVPDGDTDTNVLPSNIKKFEYRPNWRRKA